MKRITLTLYLLVILMITSAKAQNFALPQIAPKSPNIAAIDKYGEIPVSLNTGTPQISIPLYNLELDGLTIPITLSYQCNGFQPKEIASWAGYGWNLQVGGSISWATQGLPDFSPNGILNNYATFAKYFRGQMTGIERYTYLEEVMAQLQDTEFDRFNLNLLGSNTSFYFDTLKKVVLSPKSDIRLTMLSTGSFKVLDTRGNQFFFEQNEYGTASDNADINLRQNGTNTTALLTKIITKNGRMIRFTYTPYSYNYNRDNIIRKILPAPQVGGGYCPANGIFGSSTHITQDWLLLDSILFDGGYVKFLKSTTNRADLSLFNTTGIPSLASIKIANSNTRTVKQFNLIQSYYSGNTKLKLDAVQELVGASLARRWDFNYLPGGGSDFFTYAIDHWGYYNGATSNGSLLPDADWAGSYGFPSQGSANRTSNFFWSKSGVLQSIRYPTGGATEFEYEPNQIKVKKFEEIPFSPFLLWPENTFPFPVTSIAYGASNNTTYYQGSFTLPDTMLGSFQWYIPKDPGYLMDANITFTGPQEGADALNTLKNTGCSPANCSGTRPIRLPPGTYTWYCQAGNNTYGEMEPLDCNFEITAKYIFHSPLPPFELPGLRVKKITSRDSTGINPPIIKEYIYQDSLKDVLLRNIPNYMTSVFQNIQDVQYCLPCGMEYTFSGESVAPFVGSTIEYSKVTELWDSSGRGGKVDFTYMLSPDTKGSEFGQPQVLPLYSSWQAGNLLNKKIYKRTSTGYSLVQESTNNYVSTGAMGFMPGMRVGYSEYNLASQYGGPCNRVHRLSSIPLGTVQFYQNQSQSKSISNDTIKSIRNFEYLSPVHYQQTQIEKFDSKGQSERTKFVFPLDYTNRQIATSGDALAIRKLADTNLFVPIEEIRIRTISGVDYVVGATLNMYRSDRPLLSKVYSLKTSAPILLSTFVNSNINGSGVFVKDPNYEERIVFSKFDQYGNPIEMQKKDDQLVTHLFDYKSVYPVAEITNADSGSVAFTSFEADGTGNWNIGSTQRINNDAFTGNNSYQLSNGGLLKTGINTTKEYLLSYWTKNLSALTIAGTQGSPVLSKQLGTWKCFVHRISGVSQVSLSGSGIIDEVRFLPVEAKMTTWCYEPMVGIISECSSNNIPQYYEYDELGRLMLIRDQNKNILKKVTYQFGVTE